MVGNNVIKARKSSLGNIGHTLVSGKAHGHTVRISQSKIAYLVFVPEDTCRIAVPMFDQVMLAQR